MTVYQALRKSNIEFNPWDADVIGTKAGITARDKGLVLQKVKENPWHKMEKGPYMVNDFPEEFVPELFSLIAEHFTAREPAKKKRKRILKSRS